MAEDDDMDYDALIDDFDMEDALECCKDCGIVVEGDFPLELVKAALRNRYVPSTKNSTEVFDLLDTNKSGRLERAEVQIAVAMLSGILLSPEHLTDKIKEVDTDGNGSLSRAEFDSW